MTEAEKLNMVRDFWRLADSGLRDERDRMRTGFNFYVGNQWDAADLEKLAAEKRPALTINLILPIINLLAGIQRQGRQDITVAAGRGGLARLAEVFTATLRHCMDATDAEYEIADCFLDGIIGNKGWIGVGVDYADDPIGGELKVGKVSPFDMREDPDAREYDLNRSGRFVIRDMWMDAEALKLNWPGKAGDIDAGGLDVDPESGDMSGGDAGAGGGRYRVRECWWKAYEKRVVLINAATGVVRVVDEAQAQLAAAIAAQGKRWTVKEWVAPVLNKTVTAGNVVLEDVRDPYGGVTAFPYYRFCPYWVDGYVMGVVQNLQGPQQEVNKRRSQALHNLNQTANSGFLVKKALNNYDRHLARHGSTPGVVLDESKAGGKIERIEPAPLSEGHITAAQMSAGDMKEISGANPNLLGHIMEGIVESGRAIELRQAQGMKVLEVVFDNFSRTQKLLALGMVDMIRFTDVYSDEEIRSIAAEKLGPGEMELLRSRKVGRYGVKIAASSTSPTARYGNFMSIMEIARMYPEQIPAEVVVENSELLNKEKIVEAIEGRPREGDAAGGSRTGARAARTLEVSREFVNTLRRPQGRVG